MLYLLTKGDSFLNRQHQIEALGRDGEKHPAYYLNRAAIFQGGEIGVTQEPPPEPDLFLTSITEWEERLWGRYTRLPSDERERLLEEWLQRRGRPIRR